MKSSYVSFVFAYVHLLHSIIEREEHEKCFFFPPNGNTKDLLVTACTPSIDESQKRQKGDYALFSVVLSKRKAL